MADEKSRIEQALREMYRKGWAGCLVAKDGDDFSAAEERRATREVYETYGIDTDDPVPAGKATLDQVCLALRSIVERLDEGNRIARGESKANDAEAWEPLEGDVKPGDQIRDQRGRLIAFKSPGAARDWNEAPVGRPVHPGAFEVLRGSVECIPHKPED